MSPAAITSPWWVGLAVLLLVLLLVLLKLTLALIEQVKELAAAAAQTSETLREALSDVHAEGRRASERAQTLGGGRKRRR